MWCLNILVATIFIGTLGHANKVLTPCPKDDIDCQTNAANKALPNILDAFPELNIDSSDPLHLDEIVGDLSTLKYKFTDCTFSGLKKCKVHDFKLDWSQSKMNFNLTCTDTELKGQYQIGGRLIVLPVEGKGPFSIHMYGYEFNFDIDLKQTQGKDGKTYLAMKKYATKAEARDRINFVLDNLFNGNKELANTVLTFANENWKEVADFVQGPVVSSVLKKVITNINKYLKTVPIEELTL